MTLISPKVCFPHPGWTLSSPPHHLPLPLLLPRHNAELAIAGLRAATSPRIGACTCIPTFLGNLAPSTVPTGTLALPGGCTTTTTTVSGSAAVGDDAPLGELLATEELLGETTTVYRLTGAVDRFGDDIDFGREVVEGGGEDVD